MVTTTEFADVLRSSGLTTVEAAKLLGVTRVTVSSYKHGGVVHSLMTRRVAYFLKTVRAAVDARELPLHADVAKADRFELIVAILKKHMPDK